LERESKITIFAAFKPIQIHIIMKKALLLIALTAMMAVGYAQEPLTYDYVIQKEGATADQIYTALVDWIATNFKAVDGDFFRDKEEKMITKDVMFDFSTSKLSLLCYCGHITYKLKFQCRDGRFRMQMTNFTHSVNPGNSQSCILGLIYDQPRRVHNGSFDEKAWNNIKEACDIHAEGLRAELEALTMKPDKEDW
jgi:hypothetical protein